MNTFDFTLLMNDLTDENDYNDVDALFSRLEVIEPPVDMVERVMSTVNRLPVPTGQNDEDLQPAI